WPRCAGRCSTPWATTVCASSPSPRWRVRPTRRSPPGWASRCPRWSVSCAAFAASGKNRRLNDGLARPLRRVRREFVHHPSRSPLVDVAQFRRIDAVCDAYERAWQQGNQPSPEDYLDRVADADRSTLRAELMLLEQHYRQKAWA